MLAGTFNATINPSTYQKLQQYQIHAHQTVITARNRSKHDEQVALRLRVGRTGYSQWLNELYVYLLPNFKHTNILPFLGYDKRLLDENDTTKFTSMMVDEELVERENTIDQTGDYYASSSSSSSSTATTSDSFEDDEDENSVGATVSDASETQADGDSSSSLVRAYHRRATIEYWVVNSYSGCITLRHYLMMHTLSWREMLCIAHGLMCGVHFLHDNAEYTYTSHLDVVRAVDGFIRSTKGAIKKAAFKDNVGYLHMKPQLAITIIHRNLSSLNIVLGPDFVPKIWNFGFACVYHPFQPINFDHFVDSPAKAVHMSSPYSPPEVLSERTYFTYQALKSHDLYSCGVLLYELLSRCVLPRIEGASEEQNLERTEPLAYSEPFSREFNRPKQLTREMLYAAVCRQRTRPTLRDGWLLGRRSNRFVQIIRELWDHDYDARLHCCTVIDRLERLSPRNYDRPNRHPISLDRVFDFRTMWPPVEETHQAPLGALAKESNLIFESLEDLRILAERKRQRRQSPSRRHRRSRRAIIRSESSGAARLGLEHHQQQQSGV